MKINQLIFSGLLASVMFTGPVMAMDDKMMMDDDHGMMSDKMSNMLHGAEGHHATGSIMIKKDKMDHATLVLSDIKIDKVPDGRVYLAKGGDYKNGIELGKLKKFRGTVKFKIPSSVDTSQYDSVVVWCKKFDVEIGRGPIKQAMMDDMGTMDNMMHDKKMDIKKDKKMMHDDKMDMKKDKMM